jgi:hypothetical protein
LWLLLDERARRTKGPGAGRRPTPLPFTEWRLDSYTFDAQAGQRVGIRVTDLDGGSLVPAFVVYDTTGAVVVNGAAAQDVASSFIAAQKSGNYTVVVYDYSASSASTGPYNLYFTLAPGADKGGTLSPGDVVTGQLAEGALDSYTFDAAIGDPIALTVTDLSAGGLTPEFTVCDPTGAFVVDGARTATVASASFNAKSIGTYTVIVYDYSPASTRVRRQTPVGSKSVRRSSVGRVALPMIPARR